MIAFLAAAAVVHACASFSTEPDAPAPDGGSSDDAPLGSDAPPPPPPAPACVLAPDAGPETLGQAHCPDGDFDLRGSASHCGACDHACGPGLACNDGICDPEIVVAAVRYQPVGPIIDGYVFFMDADDAGTPFLSRIALDGGTVTRDIGLMFAPYDLVGDTKGMYVAGYAGLAANGPKGARYSSLIDNARLVTANGGRLFYTRNGSIHSLEVDGGQTTLNVPVDAPTAGTAGPDDLYWIGSPDGGDASIGKANLTTTAIKSRGGIPASTVLAADADYLYFYDDVAQTVGRISTSLDSAPEIIARWTLPGFDGANALVVDGANVYLIVSQVAPPYFLTLVRVPKCGGVPVKLAPTAFTSIDTNGLAVDDHYVYFAGGGKVMRVPK